MLIVFVAMSSTAQAKTPPCRQGVFHPITCKSTPRPAVAGSPAKAIEAPAVARPAPPASPAAQPAERPTSAPTQQRTPAPALTQDTVVEAAPPAVDPRSVAPYACNFAEQMTLGSQVCQARQVAEARQKVGSLIHQGRCEQAVKAALSTGDEAFAGRVRDYCVERTAKPE